MSEAARPYAIGLGANLGERRQTLISAVQGLGRAGSVRAVSGLYETAPVGPPQPAYYNAAVLLDSVLTPLQLLEQLLAVEHAHGRERRERWGPRTLDLDILHSPDLVLTEPALTLPHPELLNRAFALAPLLDVLPDARDPRSGAAYADVLASLSTQGLRQLETASSWCPLLVEHGRPRFP
jgi:2-amino-4-hydroxy-6-hydroxymethyldihydropteridine diphosphokinase